MTAPTRNVAINLFQLVGTALPNARVVFGLSRAITLSDNSGLVPAGTTTVTCGANGTGTAALVPNALGKTPTQYTAEVYDEQGNKVFPARGFARFYLQDQDSLLHAILFSVPPMSQSDADAAVTDSRNWAQYVLADVPGAPALARSSKSWAQDNLIGATYGGSARDWAMGAGLIDGVTYYSARKYAVDTAADRAQTGLDRAQVSLDRIQADADVVAANAAQAQSNNNMLTAVAQAGLALAYSLAAGSVAQQDLSGVTAAALHRSPNAVVAQAIYDTSKDSDGGAWTQKVDASYLYETLNGAYLGPQASEQVARLLGPSTVGAEVVTGADAGFGSGTGWALGAGWSIANGVLTLANAATATTATTTGTASVVGQLYQIQVKFNTPPVGATGFRVLYGGQSIDFSNANADSGIRTMYASASAVSTQVQLMSIAGPVSCVVDSISIKPVTLVTSQPSGSYYQSATDGKFYRLWKNLLKSSGDFSQVWTVGASVALSGAVGSQVVTGIAGSLQSPITGLGQTLSNNYPGLMHTLAFEVGNAAARYVIIGTDNGAGFMVNAAFDLQSGTVVGTSAHPSWADTVSASIVAGSAAGRNVISLTFRSLNTATSAVRLIPSTSLPTTSGFSYVATNSGAVGVPVFSAQCEYTSSFSSWETKAATDGSQTETFRGNTARFPRMAAIVAEASRVVIYDLLSPGRPMWMVFTQGSGFGLGSNIGGLSLAVLNGRLAVACTAGFGMQVVDFASDKFAFYTTSGGGYRSNTIAQRNVAGVVLPSIPSIANASVNAVAMTTMPDAPVDPVTGLQVPTIAVATGGGVSVIKHDGSVVSSSQTLAATSIALTPYLLIAGNNGANFIWHQVQPAKAAAAFTMGSVTTGAGDMVPPSDQVGGLVAASRSRLAYRPFNAANAIGLSVWNESAPTSTLTARITGAYNTGWMAGDIRRCLLADVSVGADAQQELAGETSNFTAATTALLSVDSDYSVALNAGVIRITRVATAGGGGGLFMDLPTPPVVGKAYVFEIVTNAGASNTQYVAATNGGAASLVGNTYGTNGAANLTTRVTVFPNGTGNGKVRVLFGPARAASPTNALVGDYLEIVSLSMRVVVADRGYKNTGVAARIFGTLTKAQVGVGSQLVAWSGWSAANYVREAYNADLDFGTGASRSAAWVSLPAVLPQFPTGAELRANGVIGLVGTATAAAYDTSTGNGSVTRGVDSANQSYVSFSGLSGTYWVSLTNTGANAVSVRTGPSTGAQPLIVLPGQTLAGHVPSQGGLISVTSSSGTATFTGLSIKQESPCYAFDRSAAAGAYYRLGTNADGTLVGEVYDGTTTRTVTSPAGYAGAGFVKAALEYNTSGTLALKVNGVQVAQTTGTPLLTLNNASAVFTVGNNFALTAAFPGSICLVKPTATVPSDDASLWMYQQEAAMFRDGAQVTLPDSGVLVDMDYDPQEDKWKVASAANESAFVGLVRASSAPVSAGSISKIAGKSGIKLLARSTTNPGVDVTVPSQNLMAELLRRGEEAARNQRGLEMYDWVGGFTATENSTNVITGIAGMSIPAASTAIGAQLSNANLPGGNSLAQIVGTAGYLTASATTTQVGSAFSFLDFILPPGMEARDVYAGAQGSATLQKEGSTANYTRQFDGFRERVRFITAPGATAHVRVNARKMA